MRCCSASGRFDAIVSQPSHPWAGGAAHLYTHEFFAAREPSPRTRTESSCSGSACRSSTRSCSARCSRRSRTCSRTCRRMCRRPGLGVVPRFERAARHGAKRRRGRSPRRPRPFALARDQRSGGRDERTCCSTTTGSASSHAVPPLNRDGHNRLQSRSGRLGIQESLTFDDRRPDRARRSAGASAPRRHRRVRVAAPPARGAREARRGVAARSARSRRRRSPGRARAGQADRPRAGSSRRRSPATRITSRRAQRCCVSRRVRSHVAPIPRRSCARRSRTPSASSSRAGLPRRAIRAAKRCWRSIHSSPRFRSGIRSESKRCGCGSGRAWPAAIRRGRTKLSRWPRTISAIDATPSSILLRAEAAAAAGNHLALFEILNVLIDELDPREPSMRALIQRASELGRATPDDPELRAFREITLRRVDRLIASLRQSG